MLLTQTYPKVLERLELASSTCCSNPFCHLSPRHSAKVIFLLPSRRVWTLPLSSPTVCQPTMPLLPSAHPAWQSLLPFIPALYICSQASSQYICRAVRHQWLPPSEIKHWIMSPAPKLSCCVIHPASPPPQPPPLK